MMNTKNSEPLSLSLIKYLLPPVLIVCVIAGAIVMVKSKAKPVEKEMDRLIPHVVVQEVNSNSVELDVISQGTVSPRTATLLISEVSGVVEWISPALYAGGFFEKGEVLVKIESSDYTAAVANAKSVVAQMKLLYEQELALSSQAQKDWEDMGEGEATDLVLRIPQLEKAKADIEYAEAALKVAMRNLSFTEVKAPYDGRVKAKFVDIGQSVSPKTSQIASIYSVDSVEIRLSLSSKEASFINLPELYENEEETSSKPVVEVFAEYAGNTYSWTGYLDRTEGMIDAGTRLIYGVAKVDNPYAKEPGVNKPPLKIGMFVKARIQGRVLEKGFIIPSGALNPGDLVYTLDGDNKLHIRHVKVVKQDLEKVVISEGLEEGNQVILTPLQPVVEGMTLQPVTTES
jgi:RND family efflux transporter MFP subunit